MIYCCLSAVRATASLTDILPALKGGEDVSRQNEGRFPRRRRGKEPFLKLTDDEIGTIEEIVNEAFSEI